jgi:PAS domain S-box-containing protein
MIDPHTDRMAMFRVGIGVVVMTLCLYMTLLFVVAFWAERKAAQGKNVGDHPIVYALSSMVYATAWTFYGSVGKAATSGPLFLAIYIGPTLSMMLWWILLRRILRIKRTYRITSIADFISLRYNKSGAVAALVTVMSIVGIVPYIAVQLKAIIATSELITRSSSVSATSFGLGFFISAGVVVFTIVLGVRRLVPAARHQGMVVAMVVESCVKLIAMLAVGIFVTYFMFGGFGDILHRLAEHPVIRPGVFTGEGSSPRTTWFTWVLLAMSAFMFLPRQFHMLVVENFREDHIRVAMWLCPLYMFLITIFAFPIAIAGLLSSYPIEAADTFVLLLPFSSGHAALSLLVFLGGFAAATGMLMIESMTISTMSINHLVLPVIQRIPRLGFLKRYLLQCRWLVVAAVIFSGYWFERHVGTYFGLVDTGIISFALVMQFVPSILGGLLWRKGSKTGALLGLAAGFAVWAYTLIVPALARGGIVSAFLLQVGPWGIRNLRPEHLFGIEGLDRVTHGVLWSMLANVSFYVIWSLFREQEPDERNLADQFVGALAEAPWAAQPSGEVAVELAPRRRRIIELLCQYFPAEESSRAVGQWIAALGAGPRSDISVLELATLYNEAERYLASSIGAAAAHDAMRLADVISPLEEALLRERYAALVAKLKLGPAELARRIDYQQEREALLTAQSAELARKVEERDKEIAERRKVQEALRNSERRLAGIIDFLPDPTFAVDAKERVIIWNRAAERFTGVKAEEVLGKGDYEYALPFYGIRRPILLNLALDPSKDIEQRYARFRRQNGTLIGEAFVHRPGAEDGYMMGTAAALYDSEGNVVAAIESLRDITEAKRIEEALRTLQAKLERQLRFTEALLSAVPNPVFFRDVAGRYLGCNTAFTNMTGRRMDEISGKVLSEVWPGEHVAVLTQKDVELLLLGKKQLFEGALPDKHGRSRMVLFAQDVFRDETGAVAGIMSAFMDITERQQAEEEVRRLNAELERRVADRTAQLEAAIKELEAFSYSVSHDLRGPLRRIDGFSHILLEDYSMKLDEQGQEYLRRVRASSQRMEQLVDDLLRLSRVVRTVIRRTRVDLSAVARTIAAELQARQPEREVEFVISPELVVMADPNLMQIVLANLMENAWKFSSKHKTARIEIGATPHDGEVAYYVRDDGAGFEMAHAANLFAAFQRLHSATDFEGSGIGLATVQRIISRHKGRIWAEGAVEQGATFFFTVPGE